MCDIKFVYFQFNTNDLTCKCYARFEHIFDLLLIEIAFILLFSSRNNATNVKKDDIVQGICYKNLNGKDFIETSPPMEIKRATQIANIVFGASLDEVEKDENFPEVPKFVIECIKVIELKENIETNGIYRASGKKESIDKLKKKVGQYDRRRSIVNRDIKLMNFEFKKIIDERIKATERYKICLSER